MRNEETMCEGLLSVVIPVYNIRDYVERCVRSVLAQPDVPLEVLIVDDGSTDDSGAVCDALAAEDSRVTVIHKPNGGLSDARNYGLCHAQGEYILFMDGDDWLAENVCPGLLQMALQDRADVVIGPYGKKSKPHQPPESTAHSGAFAPRTRGMGGNRRKNHPKRGTAPATAGAALSEAESAERAAGQIRSLPDDLRVQHGVPCPEVSAQLRPCSRRGCGN